MRVAAISSCLLLHWIFGGYSPAASDDGDRGRSPVVEIESGLVSGLLRKTWKGRTVYGFEGIPYAEPPVGESRFQEARPKEPWLGVWNASAPGSKCIQYDHPGYSVQGDEDCLYVNVYTPTLPKKGENNRLFNVLVFIHGGAFMFLEGSVYKPDFMLDKDIVLVTFNYRLGPIGFFSTGDSVVPGNNGLKDQVHALKWVKRNIKYFGGNPEDVTISGMSAGGASVHYHMLSPLSRGLFQKAFSQSGTALCPWTIAEDVPAKSAAIGEYLGCPSRPSAELVKCLSSRPAKQILEAVKIFFPFMYNPYSPFGPVVEMPGEEAFISELPYHILAKGLAADVPWLSSVATHEGLYPGSEFVNNATLLKYIDENWNKVIPHILDYNYTMPREKIDQVSELVRKEYLGDSDLTIGNTEGFVQTYAVLVLLKMQEQDRDQEKTGIYLTRASHADDTAYALRNVYVNVEDSEADKSLVPIVVDIWSSFTLSGVPSTGLKSVDWTPVSKGTDDSATPFLKIASPTDIYMDEVVDMGRIRFWDSLDFNENERYSIPPAGENIRS